MAETIKFLSLTGLQAYDAQIKTFIEDKVYEGDKNSLKYVNLVDGVLKFYTVNPISEDTVAAYEVVLPKQELGHLMQLVDEAINGNLAIFGDGGQVVDSGIALSDLVAKDDLSSIQDSVDELTDYVGQIPSGYTETNIVSYINKKAEETLNAASGGSTESAASVKAALDAYKAENDPKVKANTEAIAAIKEDVDAFFADADMAESAKDTLKELQEYIKSDETGAAAMAASIKENSDAIDVLEGDVETLKTDIDAAEEALGKKAEQSALENEVAAREALDERVVVVEGKAHEHSNAAELAKIVDGDVEKWNKSEDNAAVYTDTEIDKIEAVIGEVAEGKTVVTMISEAQAAATYDDAEVKADIAELVAADEAMAADIAALKEIQHEEISVDEINALFPEA